MVNSYALSAIVHLLAKEVEIFKLAEINARIVQNALNRNKQKSSQRTLST